MLACCRILAPTHSFPFSSFTDLQHCRNTKIQNHQCRSPKESLTIAVFLRYIYFLKILAKINKSPCALINLFAHTVTFLTLHLSEKSNSLLNFIFVPWISAISLARIIFFFLYFVSSIMPIL